MNQRKWILIIGLVTLCAPFWVPKLQQMIPQRLFLSPDSVTLIGITLLMGIGANYFIPAALVRKGKKVVDFIQRHFISLSAIFMFLIFAAMILTNRYVLKSFFSSADEYSCYFLAECIRDGKWWTIPHPLSDFFETIHVGNRDGKWFSVYPPGWPLLFALGLKLHIADFANPFLSLVAVYFFFKVGKKIFGFSAACFGIFWMCISPFFLFNNASYFSHTTCLATTALFLFSYLNWAETGRASVQWAVLASISIGYGLLTRYLSMAGIAAPFLIYEMIRVVLKPNSFSRSHFISILILSVAVFLNLYFNFLITGSFFEAPNHYYHSWERLGFHRNYTILDAVLFVIFRLFYLLEWAPPIFVPIYFLALIRRGKAPIEHQLIKYGFLYLPAVYIFYYSWGGNQYGPRYYFEGFPLLMLTAGSLVCDWWRNGKMIDKKFVIGILLALLIANAYLFVKQERLYSVISSERKALYELAEKTIAEPAIVFIRGHLGRTLILTQEDAVRNQPNLQNKILYAHDLKERNKELIKFYPNRRPFLGYYDRQNGKAVFELIKN